MKKILSLIILVLISSSVFAGGLVTNTNQSAAWVRCPAMNAYTGVSAAYFNPAGLMKLDNGFHISLNNQIISQTRRIENFYTGIDGNSGLNNAVFTGTVFAPIFPSVYAVYKRDKFALSFGFLPVGGGGSANYENGLPSIEMKPSDLVYKMSATGVSEYNMKAQFEGSSIYFGYQAGISFNVSENVSLYAGLRFITAKNTYTGSIKDFELFNYMGGADWQRADSIFSGIVQSATTGALNLQAAIDLGVLVGSDPASPAVIAQLTALGVNATGFTNQMAVLGFTGAAKTYNNNSVLFNDQEADVLETGHALAPIVGMNIAAGEKLNIGIKLEMPAFIELTRDTKKDVQTGWISPADTTPETMFPTGRKYHSDMPAMLAVGISYKPLSKLNVNLSANWYFDVAENIAYGKKIRDEYVMNYTVIDKISYDLAAGLEYNITDKILVSGGYLLSRNGVNSLYQSDMSFALNSSTIGIGGAYKIGEKMQLNVGVGYTIYEQDYKHLRYEVSPALILYPKETYDKENIFFGIGLDYSF